MTRVSETDFGLQVYTHVHLLSPAEKNNRTLLKTRYNGYNGNCIGFNGNYNGVYWYVMDSIGGMFNHIGQMPITHYKNEFCNVLLEKSNGL